MFTREHKSNTVTEEQSHEGNKLIVRLIRTRYWIPKLRNLIKRLARSIINTWEGPVL
uniref:HDC07582 n=1 Tax=Drosophila melanogaster TaxID=7227 RepID=Q6IM32_DROME|nr:TPA_inf: HDC07582 [Drosophila melanogaster]